MIAILLMLFALSGCDSDDDSTEQSREVLKSGNEKVYKNQPPESLEYSYSRENVNFWVETWGKTPGKSAYVYLMNNQGEPFGYFVTDGPPVSYCAMLNTPYDIKKYNGTQVVVPLPGTDGVYYTGEGSCNTYYGRDATTGSYIEFTVGNGINYLLYDQPMDFHGAADPTPLGQTVIDDKDKK
ncbi:MAG: hypothetical protein L0H36_01065 [bacterium]|nr:hypothetical protein [bacterium]MDN5835208.1 hypothetical protein [bacterium]